MTSRRSVDELRRDLLVRLLGAGFFMLGSARGSRADLLGRVPARLPAGKSVYAVQGDVRVNGQIANASTVIGANDLVETGADGKLVYVVGKDAFLVRRNTKLQMLAYGAERFVVDTLRVVSGGLLSVFGKTRHRIQTSTATIGIRGTGVYVESELGLSYVCTCYGNTEVVASEDPETREIITSKHHDAPRYVLARDRGRGRIVPAPFKDHTDEELQILEALVGRQPPFQLPGDVYTTPRRSDY